MVAIFFCVLFFSAFYTLPSVACVAEQREYDGSCIEGTSSGGATNQLFRYLGTSNPGPDSSSAPSGSALPNNGQQTMLTISFLEFILLDILGFDAGVYVPNTSPKQYKNIETSWIDGSHVYGHSQGARPITNDNTGHIDLDAVATKFVGQNQGVRFWANMTVDFHNKIIDVYNQYDLVGQTLNTATHDATAGERFEFARFCSIYWLQNLVVTGLLPSFFNGGEEESADPVQHSFPAYTQGYFADGTRPAGEIPLAAVVGVLATLRPGLQDLTDDATCLVANINTLATTDAQGFGSPPLNGAVTEYSNAQTLSTTLPIANYSDLYTLLLGSAPASVNEPNQNFFSIIHNHNPCSSTACDHTALGVTAAAENHPHAASAYAADQLSHVDFTSNYHPLALALTFGIVRQAYVNDTYNWDIMFAAANGALSPPYSTPLQGTSNIFGDLMANACDAVSADCPGNMDFLVQAVNGGVDYYPSIDIWPSSTSVWCNQMIKDSGSCWPSACSTCDCS
jgi:hypothetical protein